MLLRHGAWVRMHDKNGNTALHWAARRGHGTLISAMLPYAEKCEPGVTRLVIAQKNSKGQVHVMHAFARECACMSAYVQGLELRFNFVGIHQNRRFHTLHHQQQ